MRNLNVAIQAMRAAGTLACMIEILVMQLLLIRVLEKEKASMDESRASESVLEMEEN